MPQAAKLPVSAYRSRISPEPLVEVLCFKHTSKVARDNTVQYQWRTLQLLPSTDCSFPCASCLTFAPRACTRGGVDELLVCCYQLEDFTT